MILVTLGTQKFQMDRLVKAIDELALVIEEDIFIQLGHSTYIPQNCEYQEFVDAVEFQKMIESCSILITHSGVGTIMRGIHAKRPVVVVPRLAKYREHVDDHQVQIACAFEEKGCVLKCEEIEKLQDIIEKARSYSFNPYDMPERNVEDIILNFIQKLDGGNQDEKYSD